MVGGSPKNGITIPSRYQQGISRGFQLTSPTTLSCAWYFPARMYRCWNFFTNVQIPHQVPLSTFAKLPSHMTLSPMGSYWPKPSPTPRSRSQSSMVKSSHHTPSEPSQSNTAIYRAKSDTGDAHIDPRSLRPFPRSAYSSTESTPSQETLYPPTARRHNTEATMPPQAAWAPTFLQPRKVQPLSKSEMSSRPPMPGYADS